jgi:hypothetical protein
MKMMNNCFFMCRRKRRKEDTLVALEILRFIMNQRPSRLGSDGEGVVEKKRRDENT